MRLSRNAWGGKNPYIRKMSAKTVETQRSFYSLDYFDLLEYVDISHPYIHNRNLDSITNIRIQDFLSGERDFFIPEQPHHPNLAYLLLTFVELKIPECPKKENPFIISNTNKPFMSLITITPEELSSVCTKSSQAYISNMYKELYREIEAKCKGTSSEWALYCSVNAGGFVLAVRDRDFVATSELSMSIRNLNFGTRRYHTYTLGNIDKRLPSDPQLDVQNNPSHFNLRLSLEDSTVLNTIERFISKDTLCEENIIGETSVSGEECAASVKNPSSAAASDCERSDTNDNDNSSRIVVFGAYDISIQITAKQFCCIYPYLCEFVFEYEHMNDIETARADKTNPCEHIENCQLFQCFRELLRSGNIRSINSRPLLNIPEFTAAESQVIKSGAVRRDKLRRFIQEQEYVLRKKVRALQDRSDILSFSAQEYRQRLEMLNDIRKSFSGIRYEPDSLLNGLVLFKHLAIILKSTEIYMDYIKEATGGMKDQLTTDMMKSLTTGITSLNSFSKLTMSQNFQSLHSPNAEMQNRIDFEEYVIAYREALRQYAKRYHDYAMKNAMIGSVSHFEPLVAISPEAESVSMETLFPSRTVFGLDGKKHQGKNEHYISAVQIPSAKHLVQLYDTLPLLYHEMSHNFRFSQARARNENIIDYVIRMLADKLSDEYTNQNHRSLSSLDISINHVFWKALREQFNNWIARKEEEHSSKYDMLTDDEHDYLNRSINGLNGILNEFIDNLCSTSNQLVNPYENFSSICKKLAMIAFSDDSRVADMKIFENLERLWQTTKGNSSTDSLIATPDGNELEESFTELVVAARNALLTQLRILFYDTPITPSYAESSDDQPSMADNLQYEVHIAVHSAFEYVGSALEQLGDDYDQDLSNIHDAIVSIVDIRNIKDYLGEMIIDVNTNSNDRTSISELHRTCVSSIEDFEYIIRHGNDVLRLAKIGYDALAQNSNMFSWDSDISIFSESLFHELRQLLNVATDNNLKISKYDTLLALNAFADKKYFEERITSFLRGTANICREVIDQTILCYKEIFADLCMCEALGLSPLGYMKAYARSHEANYNMQTDITQTRVSVVVRVLIDRLCEKRNETLDYYGRLEEAEKLEAELDEFLSDLEEEIDKARRNNTADARNTGKGIKPYVFDEYDDYKDRLMDLFVNRLDIYEDSVNIDQNLVEHVKETFNEHIASETPGCKWEEALSNSEINIRNRIAGYYNSIKFRNLDTKYSLEIANDTMEFLTDNYYYNRLTVSNVYAMILGDYTESDMADDDVDMLFNKWLDMFYIEY